MYWGCSFAYRSRKNLVFWHLENLKDQFTKVEQLKLNKFFKYLKRNYFSTDKGYNRKDFDYHSQLLNGDNTLSTNPIENQNHQLKISMGAGRLPFHKLGRKLNAFHTEHIPMHRFLYLKCSAK